ncbi:MAG: hypothetical protein AAGL18_08295 [Pseudomonadota bacterium]
MKNRVHGHHHHAHGRGPGNDKGHRCQWPDNPPKDFGDGKAHKQARGNNDRE